MSPADVDVEGFCAAVAPQPMRTVRDALFNAGCWEVARLSWEETYGGEPARADADREEQ